MSAAARGYELVRERINASPSLRLARAMFPGRWSLAAYGATSAILTEEPDEDVEALLDSVEAAIALAIARSPWNPDGSAKTETK